MWVVGSWTWWQCHFLQTHQEWPPSKLIHPANKDTHIPLIQFPGTNGAPQPIAISVLVICSSVLTDRKQNWKSSELLKWSKRAAALLRVMWSLFTCYTSFVLEADLSLPFLHTPPSLKLNEKKKKRHFVEKQVWIFFSLTQNWRSPWIRNIFQKSSWLIGSRRIPKAQVNLTLTLIRSSLMRLRRAGDVAVHCGLRLACEWATASIDADHLLPHPFLLSRPPYVTTPITCYYTPCLLPRPSSVTKLQPQIFSESEK